MVDRQQMEQDENNITMFKDSKSVTSHFFKLPKNADAALRILFYRGRLGAEFFVGPLQAD